MNVGGKERWRSARARLLLPYTLRLSARLSSLRQLLSTRESTASFQVCLGLICRQRPWLLQCAEELSYLPSDYNDTHQLTGRALDTEIERTQRQAMRRFHNWVLVWMSRLFHKFGMCVQLFYFYPRSWLSDFGFLSATAQPIKFDSSSSQVSS